MRYRKQGQQPEDTSTLGRTRLWYDIGNLDIVLCLMYLGSINCLQILIMLGANFNETDAEGLNGIFQCYVL